MNLKTVLKRTPIVGATLVTAHRALLRWRFDSRQYWENRYSAGGNSGPGSCGPLAEFKADVLNRFVHERQIHSVIEFGCGDGNQLSQAKYPQYRGLDVSRTAIEICRSRFRNDPTKSFLLYDPNSYSGSYEAELGLSLDVIYHLTEDWVFDAYMRDLFRSATRYVIIYSDDLEAPAKNSIHIRHRKFASWIGQHCAQWRLQTHIPNRYPPRRVEVGDGSWSDFWIYERALETA